MRVKSLRDLEFGIWDFGFVSLKINDISGKEISALVSERLSPGSYKYNFDGSNFPSDMYFYKLSTDNFSETKKMILTK